MSSGGVTTTIYSVIAFQWGAKHSLYILYTQVGAKNKKLHEFNILYSKA